MPDGLGGNEFTQRQRAEEQRVLAENISYILPAIRDLKKQLNEIQQEVHTVREELRNIGKLRPLKRRTLAEEAGK